ncbi:SNF2-related [Macleaya cordata]|uniref:SNF2-related n=1 Tax=Macleaya cordata TaxID=56857 RepID=A0A200PYE9_MACCD|nr:SNF2-related [Macleaya cordata]
MKRKRKRVPCGPDLSNGKESVSVPSESPRNTPPANDRLKSDISLSLSSCKKKGNDGYYFECVICDLGGNLLCCDSCPRTYHLQCLNPPLKRTPPGKWQCPKCCDPSGSQNSTRHPESSGRVRRKLIVEKSTTEIKPSGSDKVSLALRSSNPGKKKSSSKGKPAFSTSVPSLEKKLDSSQTDVSCGSKSSHSPHGGSDEGILPCANIKIDKKPDLSGRDTSGNRESSSFTMEAQSPSRILDLQPNDESSERNSDLPCSAGSPQDMLNSTLDMLNSTLGGVTEEARKRKQKVNKEDGQKKSRVNKGKPVVNASRNRGSKVTSASPETRKASRKRSSVDHQVSTSRSKEDCGTKSQGDHQKESNSPVEASHSFRELSELGFDVDKTMMCEENVPVEVKQVDRILGCRMQSNESSSACVSQLVKSSASPTHGVSEINSTSVASDLPSLLIPEENGRLLDDKPADSRAIDVEDAEGFQDAKNQSDRGTSNGNDIRVDEIHIHKGCVTNERTEEGDAIGSTGRYLNGHGPASVGSEVQDESFAKDNMLKRTEEVVMDENTDVGNANLNIHGNCPELETCETAVPCDRNTKDVVTEMRLNNSEENKIKESILETSPTVTNTVSYEFLVKWVGQSNIHNSWVSETQLKVLAKRKLENYKAKYGNTVINICQEEWSRPQRVLALRASQDGITEAFVKWSGLSYDECTWERLDEPAIETASHLIVEFQQFERQTLDKDASKDRLPSIRGECQQSEICSLVEQPKELKGGALFEHQLEALNWLRKCWHKSKNVILADEMGLGKTVSACAFLSSLYFEFKARLPCLVLVPLSTMPNWLSEFALWAPNLNVVEYHGSAKARSIIRQYEWHASDPDSSNKKTASYKFNVLLTTYEMVLADSSHLRGVPWEVLVVDEGHRLKNSGSKLFSSLNTFSFQHRVLLTGTPLQNNIGEMYNLLNFLQPASFPSLSSFEEKFNDLTTAEKVEELKKLVAPHMLRRLKKDVMKNIPPKTERMVPVELSSIQAEYYRAMLTKNYQILRNIGKGVAQQSMLNIVMQLRKVCNHPYLIPGTEPDSGSVEFLQDMRIKASAKLTLLHSMLKVLKKEGHRVLIFSQMTKLLDILDDYLNVEFGPKTYERVDGSVSVADRQAAIARFNQDKSRFVFLLSTRSCGLGINLATADTVIIYDSDFNPHADIQAMNRAHRIGQSNRLLVYRLVVRASVEERILQLAKKKLMLDQLFVNKSGSQKEVEDILRWGTEELFTDSTGLTGKDATENSSSKVEATETEQKHRRRTGGLGDVYQDKCTDGTTKIVWDENAILKLLDRSNLQYGSSESADGDLENDMLGSVKSVEWNDEPTEEQGGTELAPAVPGDVSVQSPEKKEDNAVSSTEENEWDRLLRLRWEKYQNDEEAALGRGKRLRKAVSYNEAFAPHPTETLSESGNEAEVVEPEREYTPAGRALKTKFAKLRARQKERLAQRKMIKESCPTEGQLGPQPQPPVENVREQSSAVDLEGNKVNQPFDTPNNKSDSMVKPLRVSKHGYRSSLSNPLDLPIRSRGPLSRDIFLPSHHSQSTSYMNSVLTDHNLLPVLGLCAPNANQLQSAHRNRHETCNPPRSNCTQSRVGMSLPEFPFRLTSGAGTSAERNKGKEIAEDTCNLLGTSDLLRCRLKSSILDGGFPFSSGPPTNTLGSVPDPPESSAAAFPSFQEKMALRNLAFEKIQIPKFSHAAKDVSKSYSDLFPALSLGTKVEDSVQDIPTMPLLPNFRFPSQDIPKHNQQLREVPPTLGLGQMRTTYSSLPENHKKVLDNIMMRTGSGSGSNNSFRKKLKIDSWSEDELDALWIGVRRHGRGNWDVMLRDPNLKFSKYRTCEDLFDRWEKEQVKIFDEATFLTPKSAARSNKSATSFPGISDGMMTRALHGSRLAGLGTDHCPPPKFQTHLTDMQLGRGDLISSLLPIEPSHHSAVPNERNKSLQPNFAGDFSSASSSRPGTSSNLHLEQPFLLHSMASSSLGSMGMNCSSSSNLQQNQDVQGANKYTKLPNYIDRSLNSLRDFHNSMRNAESANTDLLQNPDKKPSFGPFGHSVVKDDGVGSSSTMNKLPHWLREAVTVPARPPEPDLPPTVSAIARSVRLLYGEEKPAIPPFTVPGPPPFQPKDPRKDLKRRSRKLKHKTPDMATSSKNFQSRLLGDSSGSCSSFQLAPPLPPTAANASGFPWIEPNIPMPSLNLNLMSSPSPSYLNHSNKSGSGLSPSPEVLQLVAASCAAPRSQDRDCPPLPGMASSDILESRLPLSSPSESAVGVGGTPDLKSLCGKGKAMLSPLLGSNSSSWFELPEERMDRTESGDDSSKTQSDPSPIDRPEVEEISSEKTLSDHPGTGSEQEL